MTQNAASLQELIAKYDKPAPRYTSYPPAPYFKAFDGAPRYLQLIEESNSKGPKNVSLYFHLPFCPQRCLFCGCHTEIGATSTFIREYLDAVRREASMLLPKIDKSRRVTQIHLGGGTPNAVPLPELESLLNEVRKHLQLAEGAEVAIECDPSLLTVDKLKKLSEFGFNRISMGIQDFDRKVLDAVHRRIPKISAADWVAHAREFGFRGINLDLIYGLPHQTLETFGATLQKTLAANPDRVSVFAYAHVPWVKGHQSELDKFPMPAAAQRLEMAMLTRSTFLEAGYVPIGMDHYVKPDDELAHALANGHLHRNFQGYCSKRQTGQVYAFGASAISQLEWGYGQNIKELDLYTQAVNRGEFPLERVYYMSQLDILAREAINALMCFGVVDFDAVSQRAEAVGAIGDQYRNECLRRLTPLEAEGWFTRNGNVITVAKAGWLFVRHLAAALDPRQEAANAAQAAASEYPLKNCATVDGESDNPPQPRFSRSI